MVIYEYVGAILHIKNSFLGTLISVIISFRISSVLIQHNSQTFSIQIFYMPVEVTEAMFNFIKMLFFHEIIKNKYRKTLEFSGCISHHYLYLYILFSI